VSAAVVGTNAYENGKDAGAKGDSAELGAGQESFACHDGLTIILEV
jgi:hypothetical protein